MSRTFSDLDHNSYLTSMHNEYKSTQLWAIHPDQDRPELRLMDSYILCFIYCGLLGFIDSHKRGPLFLWNPMRSELLKVPALAEEGNSRSFYGMSFDAVTGKRKLVYVYHDWEGPVLAHVLVLGTSSWRRIPSVPSCVDTITYDMNVSAYGNMHWLLVDHFDDNCAMKDNRILTFDFKKEEFEWTPHPNFPKNGNYQELNLINSRGSLAVINRMSDDKLEIHVLKNYKEKTWSIDYSIDITAGIECRLWSEYAVSGGWQHGIALRDHAAFSRPSHHLVFYDLRCGQMKETGERIACNSPWSCVFSYTGGLISLKEYGGLLKRKKWPHYFTRLKMERIK